MRKNYSLQNQNCYLRREKMKRNVGITRFGTAEAHNISRNHQIHGINLPSVYSSCPPLYSLSLHQISTSTHSHLSPTTPLLLASAPPPIPSVPKP